MARPFTRQQALENAAFLEALARTDNIRLAARETGLKYGTVQHRRAHHPAFAAKCDAALASAQARFAEQGRQGPSRNPTGEGRGHRTLGGEVVVVRRNDGKLQVRSAQPGKLTRQCEQAFLAALSATANVRLSAAAAGASVAAFYRRRRKNPAFAREMRLAPEHGYERIEMALIAGWSADSYEDDEWRHNEPPDMPPMTPNQALQLMYLHQKEARLGGTPEPLRRRPGETYEAVSMRVALLYEQRRQREREKFEVAEAARRERGEPCRTDSLRARLPDLAQVTGWSKADPKKRAHHPGRALFGGWRIQDLEKLKK